MNVLVTGGSGFIGCNFLRLSLSLHPEHDYANLDKLSYAANPMSTADLDREENYRFFLGDIADADVVRRVFEEVKPDLVVHFAAESHVDRSILGPRDFIKTNIEGTFNLLEACRERWGSGHGLFHHVSTDEVFGSLGGEGFFSETTPYNPSSPYSASKASSDHLVRAWHHTFGLPIEITNCSNNYGPYQFPEKLIPLMISNALAGKPLPIYGDGSNVRDWLYVTDHCNAIWAVIDRGRTGETYTVGGNCEKTNLEVVDHILSTVASETGRDLEQLLQLKTFVTDRPGHDQRYAIDASRVRSECGFAPVETFESGMRKTVRWYLDNTDWTAAIQSGEYQQWIERNYGAAREELGNP